MAARSLSGGRAQTAEVARNMGSSRVLPRRLCLSAREAGTSRETGVGGTGENADMNPPELNAQRRAEAIASLRRYAEVNLPEPIGELAAGLLLDFFLEEIGPVVYNKAISDAQERIQLRLLDLPGELYAEEFQYWPR